MGPPVHDKGKPCVLAIPLWSAQVSPTQLTNAIRFSALPKGLMVPWTGLGDSLAFCRGVNDPVSKPTTHEGLGNFAECLRSVRKTREA